MDFNPNIERLLGVADILLLPSEYESFGLVALEAMASEVLVVASSVGGLPEVVKDGETGVLRPKGDIEGMADASLALLDNVPLRKQMGENARRVALESFAPDKVLSSYLSLYERVLALDGPEHE